MEGHWQYAELEFRYARGHERPTRIRWSPPDPAARITAGMPHDADPLTAMMGALGAPVEGDAEPILEVHLLNVLGARGWELAHLRAVPSGSSERTVYLFRRRAEPARRAPD
jgi:hypothetical protein